MQRLRIRLFGPPRVEIDGVALHVDTRKAVALLAYLATSGTPHSRDALAALLWPEYDDARARSSLRRTLSVLHKALGGRWLTIGRGTLGFEPPGAWSDIGEFRDLLDQCNAHVHDSPERCTFCVERLTRLADLYAGDFMSGFSLRDSPEFEEWQTQQAESLKRDVDAVLDRLVRAHMQRSELSAAIACAQRRLALDTLNEASHSTLMQLFALAGDRAAALRQYRDCVRVLDQDLGVAPLEETTRLYQTIVAGEVTPPPVLAAATMQAPTGPPAAGAAERSVRQLPLAGRDAEWGALIRAYARITENGRVIVLEGEAGIGKTRLARELVEHVRQRHGRVIAGQCYEGEVNLPYGPVIALLRAAQALPEAAARLTAIEEHDLVEAARILPELSQIAPGLPAPPALDSPAARSRFFEGLIAVLTAALEGETPGLLLIDDLHWADEASLDLITYLARRLQGRPLCIVLTWRSEELPTGHRLRRLLAERQREGGAEHLELRRLDPSAVQTLVASVIAGDVDSSSVAARLFDETDGLPFFIAQYLAAAIDHRQPGEPWSVPGGIRDLLRSRVTQAGETELQVLTAAAVIGRSFSFDVLREACGRGEEEAITSLESLVRSALLVPSTATEVGGEPSYDFSHERLRAFVYEETSPARRRLLHRRVAAALARGVSGRRPSAVAGIVAQHYRLAGQEAEAAEYFRLAGEHARSLNANVEALVHLQTALATGHPSPALLHEEIGELLTLTGAYGSALISYQTAAALATPQRLPAIEHRIGGLYLRMGAWTLAEEHLSAALAGYATAGQEGDVARALADRSLAAHRQGKTAEATDLAERARVLAEHAQDRQAIAQAHNILGILASSNGELGGALAHLNLSLEQAEQMEDIGARVAALNNLALVKRALHEVDQARALTDQALVLCIRQGDRHREAALRNNLADLLRECGQVEESMEQLKQAVTIFAEIGADREVLEPEIWKLFEW